MKTAHFLLALFALCSLQLAAAVHKPRLIYYYQTIEQGMLPLIHPNPVVTHIHLSSIHFNEIDGKLVVHLNDNDIFDPEYTTLWTQLAEAKAVGINIVVMIGGAGGAYATLFANFEPYYAVFVKALKAHPFITGFDLDIEEYVDIANVKMLITRLKHDFPTYSLAMAPVQSSLQSDEPGMGGFVYKDLFKSPEGLLIDYFNGQFYGDYSVDAYDQCIQNGYPASMVVMGMYSEMDITANAATVATLAAKYPDFGGVFDWEYWTAPPGAPNHPEQWSLVMAKAMGVGVEAKEPTVWETVAEYGVSAVAVEMKAILSDKPLSR